MSKTEIKDIDGTVTVKWTDAYGVEITEGSLIVYAVRRSSTMDIYKALVLRTNSRYIYVETDDRSWWRTYRKLPTKRSARLYATSNIIVYGKMQEALVMTGNDDITFVDALLIQEEVAK